MAHMIEFNDGKAQIAWAGETPWHGLGTKVPHDLTPEQIMKAAGVDWTVEKYPVFAHIGDKQVETGRQALVRSSDNKLLDIISDDWNPCQNETAFNFFNDFVAAGEMDMDVAGSLKDGQIVWALAKIKDSFELFGGRDQVDSYLLFSNPHKYGQSIDVRLTTTRVVCNNTLTLSLNSASKNFVKVNHRREFDPEMVKEALGVSHDKLQKYKEAAEFLSSKRYTDETMVEYFKRIFPTSSTDKEMSRNAEHAIDVVPQQPGAELGEGSFWQLFNAATFMTNHVIGRNNENRLKSLWYGSSKDLNVRALETAVEMANVA